MKILIIYSNCNCLCWDDDGDLLAASAEKSSRVLLWDSQSRRPQPIVTGLGEGVSWLGWSPSSLLAIATSKGNLVLYNHRTARRMPILGKHNRL
jgi:WD repeat-containing protein 19